jgi:TolB-like protein
MSFIAELRRRRVVRVAAVYVVVGWLLTEILTTVLPTVGAPAWLPRAVVLVFALGFVPAVVLAWFFQVTPEGIKRDTAAQGPSPAGHRLTDYVTVGGVIVLVLVAGFFAARHGGDAEVTAGAIAKVDAASLAVLPFDNMSPDPDNVYFSDGLAETLLHMLAQVPDLKVAAKTSSFAFKGQNRQIGEIAAALGVAHILEGSVQRAGDQVRITAQLIRASDGFHVWSERYDRTVDDIFEVQDEIALKVGSALTKSLLGPATASLSAVQTQNPDAYELYLRAREQLSTYSYGGLAAAEDLLKGALLIDPGFVETKIELASVYLRQVETGLMAPAEAYAEVEAITSQVLQTRPDDAVARALFAYVDTIGALTRGESADLQGLVAELEGLAASAPDAVEPAFLLVRTYGVLEQDDEAAAVLERTLKKDPFNPRILYELGTVYIRLDRVEEAGEVLQKSLDIEPAQPNARVHLATIAASAGDGVGFVRHVLDAMEVDPRDQELPGMLAEFLYGLELVEEGDDFRDRVVAIAPTSEIAYRTELLRAIAMGDPEAAEDSARRALADDIGPRHFAFAGAVQYLLRKAVAEGHVEEELEWIETRQPGIFAIGAGEVPAKFRLAQRVAFDAWYVSLPNSELLRRLDAFLEFRRTRGYSLQEQPLAEVDRLALRGEVAAAIELALSDVFTRSVAASLGWERTLAQAQYAEIVADPRIGAAIANWRAEEDALRKDVRAYLEDLRKEE